MPPGFPPFPRAFGWIVIERKGGLLLIKDNLRLLPWRQFASSGLVVISALSSAWFFRGRRTQDWPLDLGYEVLGSLLLLVAVIACVAILRAAHHARNPLVIDTTSQVIRRGNRIFFAGPFTGTDVHPSRSPETVTTYRVRVLKTGGAFQVHDASTQTEAIELAELLASELGVPRK